MPARVTLDFVRDLSGGPGQPPTRDNKCVIAGGQDTCDLVTMDPDEFPVIARFGDEKTFSMQGGVFQRLVNRTAFAAAREPGRYAMHGVLAEIEDGVLKLVATDGRRLALASAACDSRPVDSPSPRDRPHQGACNLFCRVISDPLDQIEIFFGENQVGLRTKNAEIFARLIDGEFPRYAAVIPNDAHNLVEADAMLLTKKLRLVANVTGTEARAVRLKFANGGSGGPRALRPVGGPRRSARAHGGRLQGREGRDRLQPRLRDRRPEELRRRHGQACSSTRRRARASSRWARTTSTS